MPLVPLVLQLDPLSVNDQTTFLTQALNLQSEQHSSLQGPLKYSESLSLFSCHRTVSFTIPPFGEHVLQGEVLRCMRLSLQLAQIREPVQPDPDENPLLPYSNPYDSRLLPES